MKIDMTFLKLLLNGGLIFMASMSLASDENTINSLLEWDFNYRLLDDIVPMQYDIWLRPFIYTYTYIAEGGRDKKVIDLIQKNESIIKEAKDRGEKLDYHIHFYGQSNVSINIYHATRQIVLHSLKLYIDENATTLLRKDGVVGLYKPSEHLYDHDILILNFTDEVPSGYYNLQMKFVGVIPNDTVKGFFIKLYYQRPKSSNWIIATNLLPIGARQVFPCWDEPAFKAIFNISIKHDTQYSAVSNMPRFDEEKVNKDSTFWTHFRPTPKISTYLVKVILTDATPFSEDELNKVTHKWRSAIFATFQYMQLTPNIAIKVMMSLQEKWINYINISKLEHIVIPDFETKLDAFLNNDMDSWGMLVYREVDVIYDELDPTWRKIEVTRLVAFKMARQLFVNLVSPSWWSHMWLNEALAQFFGMDAHDRAYPEQRVIDLFVVRDQQESLRLDNKPIMMPLAAHLRYFSEIQNFFYMYPYAFTLRYKAPFIIRMLQHIVTNEIFEMGIRRYLDKHSATPDDLWKIIQNILNESNQQRHKEYNLKEVMDTWINLIHYPVVNVTINLRGNIVITSDTHPDIWWIPLTYTTQTRIDFNDTSPKRLLHTASALSLRNEEGWIIMNLQQSGYYRVNYFSENWWKIAAFLNSDQYMKIHVLNRAQIIDDAYHFLVIGELKFPIFLELTKYLSRETDYIAWYPMFKILEHISNAIPLSVVHRPIAIIKVYMRNILGKLFRKIGYEEKSEEDDLTKCLRQEATKWAYILGDSEYIKKVATELQGELENLKQQTCYSILSKCETWTYYKNSLEKEINPDIAYINYMMFKLHIAFLNRAEDSFWTDKRKRKRKREYEEYENSVLYIITKHAENKKVLEYVLKNLAVIVPSKLGIRGQIAVLISIINHVYSNNQLNMMSQLLVELFPQQKQLTSILKSRIKTRASGFTNDFINYIYLHYPKYDQLINN